MVWFVIAIIVFLIGLGLLIFLPGESTIERKGRYDREAETITQRSLKPLSGVAFVLAILIFLPSMFAVVGTKNVGVPTQFSKITGDTYGPGLNFKPPWVSVTDIDATVQVEEYKGDDCIYVKIADGGTACISLAYRWRINPDGAAQVFEDYRKSEDGVTEAVRKALVSTNIKAAINEVLGKYDPLAGADISADMSAEDISKLKINVVPDYETINADIKKNLEAKIATLGGLIDIQTVTVSYVKLPDATEKKINAFNQAVQDTKIALQEIATKTAQAKANEILADSLRDPNVLVAKCLDGLISGDITNEPGFSCSLVGGGSVVIPGTK